MWIKLDGETIIGHLHLPRLVHKTGSFSDHGFDAEIGEQRLVNSVGNYKYKLVAGELVELDQNGIDTHPTNMDNEDGAKVDKAVELILRRIAFQEVMDTAAAPQRLKDKASALKTKATQDLLALLGL